MHVLHEVTQVEMKTKLISYSSQGPVGSNNSDSSELEHAITTILSGTLSTEHIAFVFRNVHM